MYKRLTAAILGLSLLGGSVVAAVPAQASTAPKYLCYNNGSVPKQLTANTSPKTCNGIYRITVSGKMVAQLDNRRVKNYADLLKRLQAGYTASQKWCAQNSLTCTIVTSVGSLLLGGVIKRTITG
ncbi:hypothetical protein GCM10017714_35000 [Curtobacterium pusillum]|uniref:Uncharacterized protein n=1 Tax=Curtobacterium pusillum TaxID=69373 RepID=A0AAW3T7S1_9MICO|nr:hypothetical protein [Curtobacterium pusillum]MBA8991078.1 hypothetical protein [Curtobacterium pusillum]NUU15204.1 hypothetical protein [Curtobacterium pusillum]GLK31465.1 hypothetical protein GCM10017610_17500 [Curtobacterium pusillum]